MSVPGHLSTLESSGLILLARLQPEVEYLFRHALVQEAAYTTLVRFDRRLLHQAVGQSLERLYPAQVASAELAPVLARHFAEAGDHARAGQYFAQAGRAAAMVYANTEAISFFTQALEQAQAGAAAGAVVVDLFLRRGRALELNAQDAAALANYEALEAWASAHADRPAELASLAARATIYVRPSVEQNLQAGFDLSQRALALARELNDPASEAKAQWNLLQYYLDVSDLAAAVRHGELALDLTRRHGLREQEAYVLTDLLKAYFQSERPDEAAAALEQARVIWRELGVLNMLADNLASTSMTLIMSGRYDQALAQADEALHIGRAIANLWNQAYAHYLVDLVHFERGHIGQALAVAETCRSLSEQAGFAEGVQQASLDLAVIHAYMGSLAHAFALTRASQEREARGTGLPDTWRNSDGLLARLHLLAGQPAEAAAILAGSAARDPQRSELRRRFYFTQYLFTEIEAELALLAGEPERALALVEEVYPVFVRSQIGLLLPDVLLLKARALRAAGRAAEALPVLESARAAAETQVSRRALWPILAELAELAGLRGATAEAQALRQRAAETIAYIADHAGSPDLALSFLQLPAVQAVRSAASLSV